MKKDDIIKLAKENHTIEYDYSLVKDANKMDKAVYRWNTKMDES